MMIPKTLMKVASGGYIAIKNASKTLKAKNMEYIKENLLNDEFVTRKEYDILHKTVLKLAKELEELKKQQGNKIKKS